MAQPVWITDAGSLGTIPESVFYQFPLCAQVPPEPVTANCTNTTAGAIGAPVDQRNIITCDSTASAKVGYTVVFTGIPFGGIADDTTYYVLRVLSPTEFQITDDPDNVNALPLTTASGVMTATFYQRIFYKIQAGRLPQGTQLLPNGVCVGVPQAVSIVQGTPLPVNSDVTSKFTVRAYTTTTVNNATVTDRLADRTFSLTVSGNDPPLWITPAGQLAQYYDSQFVDIQLQYNNADASDVNIVRLLRGALPLGLRLTEQGRIYGYIRPVPDDEQPVGYDRQPYMTAPYDFPAAAISKNFEFTLEVTDGSLNDVRTFSIFVYNREDITSDDTLITGDNTFVTADETTVRAPFLLNFEPSNIGTVRSENNFAYRFIGEDYDNNDIEYAISVNEGFGLPPGLSLDPYSGWYYGYIPDVGVTENTYSFFITVRERSLAISSTTAGSNIITCDTNNRPDFYLGAIVTFEGYAIGGLAEGVQYYVSSIPSDTTFTVSETLGGPDLVLTTDSVPGNQYLLGVPQDVPSSEPYPFTLTINGEVNRDVTWITPSDLGAIVNGSTSLLKVEAVNVGGTPLQYQLASGLFNQLPQGLELLPTGEIAGRTTFNTFSIDQGETTIDANTAGIQETTFDSTFVFTVNAYAEDNQQALYKVSNIKIVNGGSGYATAPTITFNEPIGAGAIQASAVATVNVGAVNSVTVTQSGAEYTEPATYTLSGGGGGSGAVLDIIMQQTGYRRVISVNKQFSVRVIRANKKPYQNLYIVAMPPPNDRALLQELLGNDQIFVPSFLFRPTDPNFGLSSEVSYLHTVGLAPETMAVYVDSLNLNHYWKNLVLGEIKTARALDADGNVIYEVVYSEIIDDLVNARGQSVAKAVGLPYAIPDPLDPLTTVGAVYPNSLINMRDQVIDVVGQTNTTLPLWMTSKQTNGRVLGFTPAWVICYTKPERSQQIAYYIQQSFGQQLNKVDFKVDRYIVDALLTKNWDAETQQWTPTPNQTTFDKLNTTGFTDLGTVAACTDLAFAEVHGRTVTEINDLGGLDGFTWVSNPAVTPPANTKVIITNGSKLIFVKQENFPLVATSDLAFTQNIEWYDSEPYSYGSNLADSGSYDYGTVIRGGYSQPCTASDAATDLITCASTLAMRVNDKVCFTGNPFGGVQETTTSGLTQIYYVQQVAAVTATATNGGTQYITVSSVADLNVDDQVWLQQWNKVTVTQVNSGDLKVYVGDTSGLVANQQIILDEDFGNLIAGTVYYVRTIYTGAVTVSTTSGGSAIDPGTDLGTVTAAVSGPLGGIEPLDADGLPLAYWIVDIVGSSIQLALTQGGSPISMNSQSGSMVIYRNAFAVAATPDAASPLALTTDTGLMNVRYGNDRMAIWTISVDANNIVSLTLGTQTVYNDYVTSSQGQKYTNGTYLYNPIEPQSSLSRVAWTNLIIAENATAQETTFDQDSVQWVEPVDMYDPTDAYDKYLVFPKQNILE